MLGRYDLMSFVSTGYGQRLMGRWWRGLKIPAGTFCLWRSFEPFIVADIYGFFEEFAGFGGSVRQKVSAIDLFDH